MSSACAEWQDWAAAASRRQPRTRTSTTCSTAMTRRPQAGKRLMLIIDCHGHYTTAPERASEVPRPAARAAQGSERCPCRRRRASATTRSARRSRRTSCKLQRERGADITLFSPRASAMAHHVGDEATSLAWTRACNDLIKRVVDLYPENFVGVCQLPQSPGVPIANSIARARALRDRARLRRLQPQSRSVGRPLDVAAADRPALVSVLREDGRARRAGDDPRLGVVQSELPCHRRALHQRRHDGVHAVHRGRSVPRFSDAALRHPARRRRRAVSLGPLSRPRRHAQAPAARAARHEERVLRHLRLSPARHRPAGRR